MPNTDFVSLGIRSNAYKRLITFAARLQMERGKRVTMTDALNTLLDQAGQGCKSGSADN